MATIAVDFYQQLFSSDNSQDFDEVLDQIPQVVTTDMNTQLTHEFNAVEVEMALKQMSPLKSPGPDEIGRASCRERVLMSV